ncbi:MAG TPA: hypothetical protein VNT42_04990 [Sphingomonas sp.]|nr:hypothetical protein [Sphingomonas sp.]
MLTGHADQLPPDLSLAVLFAPYMLQYVADYRGALQRWFASIRIGGFLVITVPHSFLNERQDSPPSRRDAAQRRIYTPRALIEEIEEALVPNSYRVRWLGDLDEGYDYSAGEVAGQADIAVVLERICQPAWDLTEPAIVRPAPEDLFEPDRSRVEARSLRAAHKILAIKLDHLGDFILGIAALERLRAAFPESEITLMVGSWNEGLARELAIADHVIVFDALPRNAGEEGTDIGGKTALFDALITDRYDLAIDLRTDSDTRLLLRNVQAAIKAGVGLKARFPFLDIFLPLDPHIEHLDIAWSDEIRPAQFAAQSHCRRSSFSIACPGGPTDDLGAIIWGPYRPLTPGEYVFEPFLEFEPDRRGLLGCDIALNVDRAAYLVHPEAGSGKLTFENRLKDALFEFRLFPVAGEPVPGFRFYGGRLSKRGTGSALHQSEYLVLLVELAVLRIKQTGLFGEVAT